MATAKEHFGCESITGLGLEMSGGPMSAGAHWETVLMGNDIETSMVNNYMAVSNMTLALFEDSGWYKPDYSKAEDLWWGKNGGCALFDT